ncbi:porin family protein [Treponema primitia]|uniref:outer membrane beta-barrel protein n=1 Tax=Treponema primitia TaxID=88058 RepID=UPI003981290E
MAKSRFLKVAVFLLLIGVTASVSAQVTISAGFALSSMEAKYGSTSFSGETGVGGNVYVDYLLPIGVPLSLGVEFGVDAASVEDTTGGVTTKVEGTAIPLLVRAAYHFDLFPSLDLYAVGKIGYVLGSAEAYGTTESGYNGVGFGIDLGAAYYISSNFGFFLEAGFDQYNAEKEFTAYDGTTFTVEVPFTRFLTFGISAKF